MELLLSPVAPSPWLTGFAAMALGCLFDGIHFMGSSGPGAVGVIYSAARLPCQQSGIHYYVCYLPAACGRFLHPVQPSPEQSAQGGRDNTHVSAIPQG